MFIFKMLKFVEPLEHAFALCLNFSVLKRKNSGIYYYWTFIKRKFIGLFFKSVEWLPMSVWNFFSLKATFMYYFNPFFSVTFGAINFLNLSCKFSWRCMIGLLHLIKSSLEMTCGEWRLLVSTLVGEHTGPAHCRDLGQAPSSSGILEPVGMPQGQSVWPLIALPDIHWSDKPVFNILSWEFVVFTWHWLMVNFPRM